MKHFCTFFFFWTSQKINKYIIYIYDTNIIYIINDK